MDNKHEEINNIYSSIHETDIKEEDYLLTYDPAIVFEDSQKIDYLILQSISTTGSALGSGKYAGHGFALRTYGFKEDADWVIKKHIDWNKNVSNILIPVKKGTIVKEDDEEKIAYRMMLQKILRIDKINVEDMKEHIQRLLNDYKIK